MNLDLSNPLAAFRLDGELAAVTGGGSGIGRAIAIAFARVGGIVYVLDRDETAARAVADEIKSFGGEAAPAKLDVTNGSEVERVLATIFERHQRLDILVNSAGVAIRKPALELSVEEWEQVNAVNVTGSFLCARAAARHMLPRGAGRIINVASTMGLSGGIYPNAAYQTSKGAVVNLTRALAIEWAHQGIRVNALAPTWIKTPLTQPLFNDPIARAQIEKVTPLGRVGEPEDIVGAAIYLASRASALVTGHILVVDGGFLAQ